MRVMLINPPAIEAYGKYKAAAKAGATPQAPLGVCYIAAQLEKHGHDVRLIDADIEGYGPDEISQEIKDFKPEVLGITATTPIYPTANKIFSLAKEIDKSLVTILGGFHITALPMRTMKESTADFGLFGEAEETIVELLDCIKEGKEPSGVKGILFRKGKEIMMNPLREQIQNLDALPFPALHLLKHDKYLWSVPGKGTVPVAAITTQRGCPFQCIFCGVQTMFKGIRYRSIPNVVDEIEHRVNELGIKHFYIQDDTMTMNKAKMLDMCREIKKRKLEVTWEGYTRANTITPELLQVMKDAGLVRLSFGVESGNDKVLKAIKKGIKKEDMVKAYEMCHAAGIETRGSFMLGHPFETKETIKETIDFAKSLKMYQAYINITTPYPGSELYTLAKEGYGGITLLTDDWQEFRRYGNAVMEMNDLTKDDLIKLQKKAYRQFYLRPHIIWYNIRRAGLRAAWQNGVAFFKSVLR
ncbi:MAG: B12-binding domain-containing radical SAM protein [Nanoarchaeota archaeon]|nr:B12-binding domain-containing radical SAM protein [Nanoarchaeota archaeon]